MSLDNLLKELPRVMKGYFVAFEVNALDPISFVRFNIVNPTIGISNISKNQRALFPGRITRMLEDNGFSDVSIKYEDMHDYVGRRPDSLKARMILAYQKAMKLFPDKYSQNKFLLRAEKR